MGAVGAVLPLLPAFPFLLVAAICFGRGSERINTWFLNTKLYKENLEPFRNGKGMTKKTKIKIMITVTVLMSIGFTFMRNVPVGQLILVCVWIFHILYFIFGVKNMKQETVID
jgi:hypothetical protein